MFILWFSLGILVVVIILLLMANHTKIIKSVDILTNKEDIRSDDYTTLYQSQILINMGLMKRLPLFYPSAYYVYYAWVYNSTPMYLHVNNPTLAFEKTGDDYIPAWSSYKLIELISSVVDNLEIKYENNYYRLKFKIGKKLYITELDYYLSDLLFTVVYFLLKADIIKENIEEEEN